MEWKAISCVTGAILINLTLGTFYSFGNIVLYIISYMRKHGNPDLTVEYGISLAGTYLFGQGAFMILGSYIERTWNSRVACIIGCIIHSGSTYLTMWAVDQSFIVFVLVFGLGSGLGCGSSYMAAIIAAQKWFPNRKGLITGMIVAGFGLGTAIASPLQTLYINPKNLETSNGYTDSVDNSNPNAKTNASYFEQEEILERVPYLFLYSGIVFTVVQAIGCTLAFPPPGGKDTSSNDRWPSIVDENALPDMRSFSSAFNYRIFYMIGLLMMLVSPGYSFVVTMSKNYGQKNYDDQFLANIIGFAAVANAVGRLCWGTLMDRFTFSQCFMMKVVSFTAFIVTFPFEYILTTKSLYTIWVLALYFCFSGTFVLFPVLIEQVFGVKYNGTIYGILYLALATSSIVTSVIIQTTLKNSVDSEILRIIPCVVVGALYVMALCLYWLLIPVRRLENSIKSRKVTENIKNKDTLLNRADLFPNGLRKTLGEKTAGSSQSLKKENSLGSIVRFSDQPLPTHQRLRAIQV